MLWSYRKEVLLRLLVLSESGRNLLVTSRDADSRHACALR